MAYATEVDTLRGNWIRFIYGTARISDSTRVLMLALSEGMRPDGHVEISRNEAANLISRSPRRVSGRYTDAIEAGVLKQIARGNRKNKSVFQALIPSGEEVTHGGHLFPGEQRTDSRPHSSKTTDTPGAHVHEETGDTRGHGRGRPRDTRASPVPNAL